MHSSKAAMPTSVQDKIVFVIDDDEIIRLSCEQILKKSGYTVETFASGHVGIERLKQVRPPLLVVDIKMPELDGFEVIKIVRKIDPNVVIVVIPGYATIETAVDAMKMGAYDFLPKPFTPSELRLIIDRGFERWRLASEAQRLRKEKEEVEMLTYLVVFLLIIHGLAHMTGVVGFWASVSRAFGDQVWIFSQGASARSLVGRAWGLLWLVAGIGLIATGLGLLFGQAWWPSLAVGAAIVSLLAIVPW